MATRSQASSWIATGVIAWVGATAACSGDADPRGTNTGGTQAGTFAAGTSGSGDTGGGGAETSGSAGASSAGTDHVAGAGGASAGTTAAGASGADAGAGGASESGAGAGSAGTRSGGPIDCRVDGDGSTTLVFVNRCARSVTFRGSDIDGGELAPGAFACVTIGSATEVLSAKRYWGFIGEDPGGERHTLAEFTFNTDFNDFDWYNISHVDAFNLPMQIAPVARSDCQTLTCAEDFLLNCPDAGRYEDSAGNLTSCVSPDRDDGASEVALYFEACDDGYAWSGDDANGDDPSPVRACAGEDWDITFCPESGA